MNILGIHIGHDAALAIIRDGRLISTSSVERYSRNKKDMNITKSQVDLFLYANGLHLEDVDYITITTWVKELAPWMSIYSPEDQKYPLTTYGT